MIVILEKGYLVIKMFSVSEMDNLLRIFDNKLLNLSSYDAKVKEK